MSRKRLGVIGAWLALALLWPGGYSLATRQVAAKATGVHRQMQPEGLIAFVGSDSNVWLVRPDGSDARRITEDARAGPPISVGYSHLRWSPTGDLLAMIRYQSGAEGHAASIMLFDPGTGSPLKPIAEVEEGFDWSPDGRQLIYGRPVNLEWQMVPFYSAHFLSFNGLWVADLASGGTDRLVPPTSDLPLLRPDWSPTGNHVGFYVTRGHPEGGLVGALAVADLSTSGNRHQLAEGGEAAWQPRRPPRSRISSRPRPRSSQRCKPRPTIPSTARRRADGQ